MGKKEDGGLTFLNLLIKKKPHFINICFILCLKNAAVDSKKVLLLQEDVIFRHSASLRHSAAVPEESPQNVLVVDMSVCPLSPVFGTFKKEENKHC